MSALQLNEMKAKQRPVISEYSDIAKYMSEMLIYLKQTEPNFSVLMACRTLRKISPTLVSLVVSRKRKLTLDRVEETASLLRLSVAEKYYLRNWVYQNESNACSEKFETPTSPHRKTNSIRKTVSVNILSDWLNVYVKDCFHLDFIQDDPESIFEYLKPIASRQRIQKSLQFLIREGHLRRQMDNKLVPEVNLTVADTETSSTKIRKFHKATLKLASSSLDLYSAEDRLANSLLLPLSKGKHREFLKLIEEFSLRIQEFASQDGLTNEETEDGKHKAILYQFLLNLSPIGGKHR